ncbi:MAG: penicillin-binding protein activator [Pseudomonadota bacterium]
MRNFLFLVVVSIALTLISGCESSGPRPSSPAVAGSNDRGTERETGDELYAQAQTARGARALAFYLRAAQAYLIEDRPREFESALVAVSPTDPTLQQRRELFNEYHLQRATWHYLNNEFATAREWLERRAPASLRTAAPGTYDQYWLLRAELSAVFGDWQDQATALMAVSDPTHFLDPPHLLEPPATTATDTGLQVPQLVLAPATEVPGDGPAKDSKPAPTPEAQARQALNDAIWRASCRTGRRAARLASSSGNPTERGWWLLRAQIAAATDRDGRQAAVRDWRRRFGSHPGAYPWPTPIARVLAPSVQSPTTTRSIAVLLPLSGALAGAGGAVRDGMIGKQLQDTSPATLRFYDVTEQPIAQLIEQLGSSDFIVGPLVKERVMELAALAPQRPALALNYLDAAGATDEETDPVEGSADATATAEPVAQDRILDTRTALATDDLRGLTAQAGATVEDEPRLAAWNNTRPPALFQLGVAIEDEARTLSQRLAEDGKERILVLYGKAGWANRAAKQIVADFPGYVRSEPFESVKTITEAVGRGMLVDSSHLRSQQIRRTLNQHIEFVPRARKDLDAIVALVSPVEARALKPALRFHFAASLPVYTTSQVLRSQDPRVRAALTGVQLTEMPGMLRRDLSQGAFNEAFGLPSSRASGLYALGADAYTLSKTLIGQDPTQGFALDGLTGHLTLQSDGQLRRELAWAVLAQNPDDSPAGELSENETRTIDP